MQIKLTVAEGPHKGESYTFIEHDTFLVGRSRHAHFRLPSKDKYFSRIHFMVEVNPPECRLVDMGSHNGTYVNGEKMLMADLKHGDKIRAGHTVFEVIVADAESGEPDAKTHLVQPPLARPLPPAAKPVVTASAAPTEEFEAIAMDQFPRYELIREIGKGSMGVVYLVKRLEDGAEMALKAIRPKVKGTPEQREQFFRETLLLRELNHPHIVRILDLGKTVEHLYFVTKYVPGSNTRTLVERNGPLPMKLAVPFACQLLEALAYAHEKGYVHSALKPSNVLVSKTAEGDSVQITDFGLALLYQSSELSGLTVTADHEGSGAFLAPERITSYREVKPPSDQYAAAALLYYWLTGEYVYSLPEQVGLRYSMLLQNSPIPIQERRPDLPDALATTIHRALSREPSDRFADVGRFRAALNAAAHSIAGHAS